MVWVGCFRIRRMVNDLGVQIKRVYELIDFYHTVEHLGKIAARRKTWNVIEGKKWMKKHKQFLKSGKIQQVIDAIKNLQRQE